MSNRVRLLAMIPGYGYLKGAAVWRLCQEAWEKVYYTVGIPIYVKVMPKWKQLLWMAKQTNGKWQIWVYREPRKTRFNKSKYLYKVKSLNILGKKVIPKNPNNILKYKVEYHVAKPPQRQPAVVLPLPQNPGNVIQWGAGNNGEHVMYDEGEF